MPPTKVPIGVRRDGTTNFLGTILTGIQEPVQEVKPQTSFTNIPDKDIEKVMENLKKGIFRKF